MKKFLLSLLIAFSCIKGVLCAEPCNGRCEGEFECDKVADLCRNKMTFKPSCDSDCPADAFCDRNANKCRWKPGQVPPDPEKQLTKEQRDFCSNHCDGSDICESPTMTCNQFSRYGPCTSPCMRVCVQPQNVCL